MSHKRKLEAIKLGDMAAICDSAQHPGDFQSKSLRGSRVKYTGESMMLRSIKVAQMQICHPKISTEFVSAKQTLLISIGERHMVYYKRGITTHIY